MSSSLRSLCAVIATAVLGISALSTPPALAATDFVTTWDTTRTTLGSTGTDSIRLPLIDSGTYNFTVDWGDGHSNPVTSYWGDSATHMYATGGTYTISITGTLDGWAFLYSGDRNKILSVDTWGPVGLGNTGGYFEGCQNLTIPATDEPDLTGTTNMNNAFHGAAVLTGGLGGWDTSAVTSMSGMFQGATLFDEDISDWDTGGVTAMNSMFRDDEAFDQPIGVWDTSAVMTMAEMFAGATHFNRPLADWDVSHVTSMDSMFGGATSFDQPLATWDTGAVTSMTAMFRSAIVFNQPLNTWDVSLVTGMGSMFEDAVAFNQPLGSWDTSAVTSLAGLFKNAVAFNQPIGGWSTGAVTGMSEMFRGAIAFDQPVGTWDVSHVTDLGYTFSGATTFNQPLAAWDTSLVTSMYETFSGATAFNQPIGGWDVGNVTTMHGMFAGATGFDQNLGPWNVGSVTDLRNLLNAVNLSVSNYNALLNGWAGLAVLHDDLALGAGNNHYSSLAQSAHDHLTAAHGWSITDGGRWYSQMDVGPSPYQFLAHEVGSTTTGTVTAISSGDAELILPTDAVTITGTDSAMFSVAEDTCSGHSFPRDAVCTVQVSFTPTSIGDKTATLELVSDAPLSPTSVPLYGTGTGALFSPDPASLDFGEQQVATTSAERVVTITNTGNLMLYIGDYNLHVRGVGAAAFGIRSTTCAGARLQPSESCRVAMTFTPLSTGRYDARLEVQDGGLGAPHAVPLSGTGVPAPTVSPTPTPTPTMLPLRAPTRVSITVKRRAVRARWAPVTDAMMYRATLKGRSVTKPVTRRWRDPGNAVTWRVRLKPGSRVSVCVWATNPAYLDSPHTCAVRRTPRR